VAPLRVLRLIARTNVGGPALQVSTLARGLDPARFEQRLLVGSVEDDEADYLELRAPDVEVVRVPGLGRRVRGADELRALRAIRREIVAFRPDIVHTHTAKAGALGRVAAWSARVPITVHTFHGHLLHGYFRPSVTRAVVLVERALAARTTHLVAVGSNVRDDLLAAGIGRPDKFSVVPPGVTVSTPPRAAARAELGLDDAGPVNAFVARLTAIKRPERVVAVARELASSHPDAVVVIVGEGALLEDLRAQAAPLGDRVRFLGWRADVDRIYAAADVVLLTSANEGMPVSLIEAAAAGRPAVSTRVGSVAEVVEDGVTGLLVPEDVAALTAAVRTVLDDDERRAAMGAAAAERADRLFGSRRLVEQTAELYERLAAARR
jgi:glycosyltransferase involved in cell wall biosynthesis